MLQLFHLKMVAMTISEMNQKLTDLNSFFQERATILVSTISKHESTFLEPDYAEFAALIQEIKKDALEKINNFIEEKLKVRSDIYQKQISIFKTAASSVDEQLLEFRKILEASTIAMKEEQNRKQQLMEHFSKKYRQNTILKKSLRGLRNYEQQRKQAKTRDEQMDLVYAKNLMKKAFFPWRTLTYKDGYATSVRREMDRDITNIHQQYRGIINILKTKIMETDQIIKVKKAAKGEFAFALSKNLLKTISNLSIQVMSLNQMSLRDGEWDQEQTQKFMVDVDRTIQEKLSKVREYRRGLIEDEREQTQREGKKRITWI